MQSIFRFAIPVLVSLFSGVLCAVEMRAQDDQKPFGEPRRAPGLSSNSDSVPATTSDSDQAEKSTTVYGGDDSSQDANSKPPTSGESSLSKPGDPQTKISFGTQVQPILASKCERCHGADEANDDIDLRLVNVWTKRLISGNDPEKSKLYQVLVTDDEDELMPPVDEEQLTKAEIATIAKWIEQGADVSDATGDYAPSKSVDPFDAKAPMATRVWVFSGLFHPAMVHFPIALFVLGAFFAVFCYRNLGLANEATYYCLVLGALSSIVASVVGWSYGYVKNQQTALLPPAAELTDIHHEFFWHRTLGVVLSVLALLIWYIAWRSRSQPYSDGGGSWKLGLILLAALAGVVGYQGGELVYGKNHYYKHFVNLFPEAFPSDDETKPNTTEPAEDANAPDSEQVTTESSPSAESGTKSEGKSSAPEDTKSE